MKKVLIFVPFLCLPVLVGIDVNKKSTSLKAESKNEEYKLTLNPNSNTKIENGEAYKYDFAVSMAPNSLKNSERSKADSDYGLVKSSDSFDTTSGFKVDGRNVPTSSYDGKIVKKADTDYLITLYGSYPAQEGRTYLFDGIFERGEEKFRVLPSRFKYTNGKYIQDEPEFKIVSKDNILVNDNNIYVREGEKLDNLLKCVQITNGYTGTAKFDGANAIKYLKEFVTKDNEIKSTYQVKIGIENGGTTFYKNFNLIVGYYDFIMNEGFSVKKGNTYSSMYCSATIPTKLLETIDYDEIGAIFVEKDKLPKEFNPYDIFESDDYTFDINSRRKIFVLKDSEPIINKGPYYTLIKGAMNGITNEELLNEYLGLIYIKTDKSYLIANYFNDSIDSNIRSFDYVAHKAFDNADYDTNIENYVKSFRIDEDVTYVINQFEDKSNILLSRKTLTGKRNNFIDINAPELTNYKVVGTNKISSRLYSKNNVFNFYYEKNLSNPIEIFAYNSPIISNENNYDNATNDKICNDLINAGFTGVIYTGIGTNSIGTKDNVDGLKGIIKMFYNHGLKTIVHGHSVGETSNHFIDELDWRSEPGFYGYIEVDEPHMNSSLDLAGYAKSFDQIYTGTNSRYMNTLFPSYSGFNMRSYLDYYTQTVIKNITNTGSRCYSIDNYPVLNGSSGAASNTTFLTDMAYVTSYAKNNNANTFFVMQGSQADVNSLTRTPTLGELKLQVFNLLAMGIRDFGWYTYASLGKNDNNYCSVNAFGDINQTLYSNIKATNLLIKQIAKELEDYEYVGVYKGNSYFTENCMKNMINNSVTLKCNDSLDLSISSMDNVYGGVYKSKTTGKYATIFTTYSTTETRTLTFGNNQNWKYYDQIDKQYASVSNKTFNLRQGEGVLIKQ